MASALRRSIAQLNLFNSYSANPAIIHKEVITTRIYLTLLFLTFSILFAYSSQREFQYTVQFNKPSINDYRNLNSIHSSTLACPCSKLAVPYKSLLTLEPVFHPICSSDFISNEWLLYMYREIPNIYDPIELRAVGYTYFQLLRTICHSSKRVIDSALRTKLTSQTLISSSGHVLTYESVHIQANAFIKDFVASIANKQQSLYRLLLAVIEGNHVWSALGTNAMAQYSPTGQFIAINRHYDLWTDTLSTRGSCRCEADYTCNTKLFLYNNTYETVENPLRVAIGQIRAIPIPGFRAGCTPLRSLLQSSSECFANATCLNMILTPLSQSGLKFDTFVINSSNNSSTKTIIDVLASNLMIIDWIIEIDYLKYFEACRPLICSYLYTERFNIFYIVTTIVGLLGGLTVTCRVFALSLSKLYFKTNTSNRRDTSGQ